MRAQPDAAPRGAELVESLWRISTGIEALNIAADRQSRIAAEGNAKLEGMLKYLAQTWQQLRELLPPLRHQGGHEG
jgi:hypothetical protein